MQSSQELEPHMQWQELSGCNFPPPGVAQQGQKQEAAEQLLLEAGGAEKHLGSCNRTRSSPVRKLCTGQSQDCSADAGRRTVWAAPAGLTPMYSTAGWINWQAPTCELDPISWWPTSSPQAVFYLPPF